VPHNSEESSPGGFSVLLFLDLSYIVRVEGITSISVKLRTDVLSSVISISWRTGSIS